MDAAFLDSVYQAVHMVLAFLMEANPLYSDICQTVYVSSGIGNHQMRVEGYGSTFANGSDERIAECEIGNVVPVHNIQVDEVGIGDLVKFILQIAKIAG